jgi:hypothetical protein
MKIRRIPVPTEYDTVPGHRDIAERAFLKALHQEKARGLATGQPSPPPSTLGSPAARAHTRGQSFGQAFAPLSGAAYDRAVSYTRAIRSGAQEAERRDNEAREVAQNSNALRELGFRGRDDDDNDDF